MTCSFLIYLFQRQDSGSAIKKLVFKILKSWWVWGYFNHTEKDKAEINVWTAVVELWFYRNFPTTEEKDIQKF